MKPLTNEDYEEVNSYMHRWEEHDNWSDFNVMLSFTVIAQIFTEMCADSLVCAGAIHPDNCYEDAKDVEKIVVRLANKWRRRSNKERDLWIGRVFKDCFIVACQDCNHASFLSDGNEELYPETKIKCTECNSTNIETRRGIK